MVVSLFWLGWTVWPSVSPVIPTLGGIFFGLGFQLLFMGMTNYLTDVFRSHSASALGAAAMLRSIGATTLPLAADSMYTNLGIHWAPSVLAFIALAMGVAGGLLMWLSEYRWKRFTGFTAPFASTAVRG